MKVSEAKTKVCPFIQYQYDQTDKLSNINCICGECMAWVTTKTHEQIENKASDSSAKVTSMSRYRDGEELSEDNKEGICLRLRG